MFINMKKDDRLNRKDLGEEVVDMKRDFIRKGKSVTGKTP